jgi:hypothetical protein
MAVSVEQARWSKFGDKLLSRTQRSSCWGQKVSPLVRQTPKRHLALSKGKYRMLFSPDRLRQSGPRRIRL